MKRLLQSAFLTALTLFAFGCDSADREDDRDRIQGSWELTAVTTGGQNVSTEFEQIGAVTATFSGDNVSFVADPAEGQNRDLVQGTFTITPVGRAIVFNTTQDVTIPGTYSFESEDVIQITLPSAVIGAVVNLYVEPDISFSDNVTFRLER